MFGFLASLAEKSFWPKKSSNIYHFVKAGYFTTLIHFQFCHFWNILPNIYLFISHWLSNNKIIIFTFVETILINGMKLVRINIRMVLVEDEKENGGPCLGTNHDGNRGTHRPKVQVLFFVLTYLHVLTQPASGTINIPS